MTVSVLIPMFKVAPFIERCARSIFSQDYASLDIVFVDDCSPDNSADIVRKVLSEFPDRADEVRIIRHQHNQGLAAARNTAVAAARGEYLFHVDGDDSIAPRTIRILVDKAKETNADIVFAGYAEERATGITEKRFPEIPSDLDDAISGAVLQHGFPWNIWNCLIRREIYTDNDITVPAGINNGEDYVTMPRLLYFANKLARVDDITYYYNQLNPAAYTANIGLRSNLLQRIAGNRFLHNFFLQKKAWEHCRETDRMMLSIKAICLLWAKSLDDIAAERRDSNILHYRYLLTRKPAYIAILLLYLLHADRTIFSIAKRFQSKFRK